ncbi:hypothetical protein PM3016_253 [Paenibacillus mucilaginosus 3016]|uniref:Uncharacterized protein n=1 Tax=Paenibacillus mucilaginosus 3016 TaxID=1116391 RepID=H6NQR9_9BACL|nr:hypothetical protein PM3016_253 [Paenibacillus mucilaginosus 3016]
MDAGELQLDYILGLWSAVALNHIELYALAFVQGFVAFSLNGAEVNEYVLAAFHFDEAKSFFRVKPFHCSCFHDRHSLQRSAKCAYTAVK